VQGLKDDAVGKVRVRREEEGVAEEVFRGRWEERRRLVLLSFASHWKLENEEKKFVVVVLRARLQTFDDATLRSI
jgi:hypothetical protein